VRFGIGLGMLRPSAWLDAAVAADELGYESLWLSEHLVFPLEMRGELKPGEEHPRVPSSLPLFDPFAYLSFIAARTSRIRLGTYIYLMGLRHPFTSARGFTTLDLLSNGRVVCGVGAGWLTTEWDAVGLEPKTRGRRLDECIEICRRLWSEEVVEYHGEFTSFPPVHFEPKPIQTPLPVHVGGESPAALRRAGRLGDGWLGMHHTPESVREQIAAVRRSAEAAGRDPAQIEITCMAAYGTSMDPVAWGAAGVDRLIVVPWQRTSGAMAAIESFAREHGLP
jgi:probable F420-dependent oxidoreductase